MVEGVVVEIERIEAVKMLAGDEAVEIDLEGDVQGFFGGGVGGIALHAQADVVELFSIEGDLGFDEGVLERREIGLEALAFDVSGFAGWAGGGASGRLGIKEGGEDAVNPGLHGLPGLGGDFDVDFVQLRGIEDGGGLVDDGLGREAGGKDEQKDECGEVAHRFFWLEP